MKKFTPKDSVTPRQMLDHVDDAIGEGMGIEHIHCAKKGNDIFQLNLNGIAK